jgi:hypothetical protein
MFQENTGATDGEDTEAKPMWDRDTEEGESRGEGRSARKGSRIGDETLEDTSGESEDNSEGEEGPYIEMVFVLLGSV